MKLPRPVEAVFRAGKYVGGSGLNVVKGAKETHDLIQTSRRQKLLEKPKVPAMYLSLTGDLLIAGLKFSPVLAARVVPIFIFGGFGYLNGMDWVSTLVIAEVGDNVGRVTVYAGLAFVPKPDHDHYKSTKRRISCLHTPGV